ncbi:MAG TPA: cbb3-type cytochrome c oxidase subunit 3 [Plasticicumulans sp.]|nr:cbb3-type cytochrome c oxidase subunit 3 [Plasticicumulans sp.]RTL01215.1 MAG: cbb3-type cytochrome c oxidase subunit 3 [Xanthomonadales bacterium]HMV39196.1 cbb3-type cytochrome c oxidase subunit 3 [Plasticicumulans sp.]HMW30391.1 cbb3-type cytochrome c oxidase subunit 3 [Plasticicumulans sp.]HMW43091.1 cbb3-type cytochrome c oxidase subunit 3 [Plasticicumulans sp.]HMX53281.1 cbb3-type cytochrome c oxidase subunit 3 [Plasticicumulans sp.]
MTVVRSVFTVLMFVIFIGIVWWAWSRHNRKRFDDAASLPFADEDTARRTVEQEDRR